ncbi:MAG: PocR ligand-binding domain-containing protein [Victivallales bacterium]|nr:PocR ligand-binding domain-containing protein [Victivallales bacterium]
MAKNENSHGGKTRESIRFKEAFYGNLLELLLTIEEITGLEVCIYPSMGNRALADTGITHLPHSFSSHFGEFCRIVKANRSGRGCGGYDSHMTVKKSAEIGKPFVNVCHAGLGEVVFPVYGYNKIHIATVFIGQVITSEIDGMGFPEIVRRVHDLGVDERKLLAAYHRLPRMGREKLLRIGTMADLAIRGLGSVMDFETFEHQVMLNQYPVIQQALRMITPNPHNLSEGQIADSLNLHQSYFSRLFKKVMKCNFQTYVTMKKIQRAKNMLHHSSSSIMRISESCGFSRQSYFTLNFKKITGMTPSEYRRIRRQSDK